MLNLKKCTSCLIEKDRSEFSKHTIRKDGLSSHCRVCKNTKAKPSAIKNRDHKIKYMEEYNKKTVEKRAEYYKIYGQEKKEIISERNKKHYQNNIERYKEIGKIYYQKNKEKSKEKSKVWREKNKERYLETTKAYLEKNKERLSEKSRIWYINNKEKSSELTRAWYANNKEKRSSTGKRWRINNRSKVREIVARRRSRLLKNGIFYISEKEITKLLSSKCYLCKTKPSEHLDHIVPICKGGVHSIGNLLGACQRCNLEKGSKTLFEYKRYKASTPS